MAKGPLEAVEARLRDLESRVGRPVVGTRLRPPRVGTLRPGGVWLQERLNPEHPEYLDRLEQDLLGQALLAHDRREFQAAQELLDQLHHGHQLRMALQQGRSGREVDELGKD